MRAPNATGRAKTRGESSRREIVSRSKDPDASTRLHGYGEAFDFPPHFSPRQASALVGNSITVPLAARLLDLLLPPEA